MCLCVFSDYFVTLVNVFPLFSVISLLFLRSPFLTKCFFLCFFAFLHFSTSLTVFSSNKTQYWGCNSECNHRLLFRIEQDQQCRFGLNRFLNEILWKHAASNPRISASLFVRCLFSLSLTIVRLFSVSQVKWNSGCELELADYEQTRVVFHSTNSCGNVFLLQWKCSQTDSHDEIAQVRLCYGLVAVKLPPTNRNICRWLCPLWHGRFQRKIIETRRMTTNHVKLKTKKQHGRGREAKKRLYRIVKPQKVRLFARPFSASVV